VEAGVDCFPGLHHQEEAAVGYPDLHQEAAVAGSQDLHRGGEGVGCLDRHPEEAEAD